MDYAHIISFRAGIDWFGNRQKQLALKSLKTGDSEELVLPVMQVEKITGKYYIYHLQKHKKTLNISHEKISRFWLDEDDGNCSGSWAPVIIN